jgi:O-antigen/teichoic acid export membrane protein
VNLKERITLPNSGKVKYWLKLITVTGTAQVIVQAVGFLSGILVIRLLSVDEYALYTLANTMLGTMTVLSDGGISTGVMAQGGKVWQDRQKLGAVLATGMELRRKFAIFSLLVSVPILGYLLLHHGATWITTVLITASLIPAFYASLSDGLLQIPVKLHQAIVPLQRNQVEVSAGRLLLTGITLFAFPWAFVAIIASGIPRIWGNIKLRKIAYGIADKEQKTDDEERREILKIVRKILPGSIYYALSGQITVWLISIFGNTTSIAQLGALGKLSVIFTFLSIIIQILIVPRFSRIQGKKILIVHRFIQMQVFLFVIGMIIVCIFVLFNNQFLYILGANYDGLVKELFFIIVAGAVSFISGLTNGLLSSRGIIVPPVIFISLSISIQIIALFIFPLDSIIGITTYQICTVSVIYFIRIIYFICCINTKNEDNNITQDYKLL